jgi:hypothetical protein
VIAEVLALVRRELAERCIEGRTELPEDLPRVFGDRVQLPAATVNVNADGLFAEQLVINGFSEPRSIYARGCWSLRERRLLLPAELFAVVKIARTCAGRTGSSRRQIAAIRRASTLLR